METIDYKFADGTKSRVEVSDELYKTAKELTDKERLNNKGERHKRLSLELLAAKKQESNDSEKIAGNITYERLNAALARLPPTQQALLDRKFVAGLTAKEIAKSDGIAVRTVRRKLERIYKKLINYL
jgi:RNA polymerase sigma factor (sigma-70 family)